MWHLQFAIKQIQELSVIVQQQQIQIDTQKQQFEN